MPQIHRFEIPNALLGSTFTAPAGVKDSPITFGYQDARKAFSIWYKNDEDRPYTDYIIVGTGHNFPMQYKLVASCVMPDGFHVFHLLEKI